MDIDNIDTNIKELVDILNYMDGIITIGSCGGHDNPQPGQCPTGSWFVTFYIVGSVGNISLQKITNVVNEFKDTTIEHMELDDGIELISPKEPFDDWYLIEGTNCADANELMVEIEKIACKWVAGFVVCEFCKVESMNVYPLNIPMIECSNCGEMTTPPPFGETKYAQPSKRTLQ